MKVVALTNRKGGVAKTTCAINIAAGVKELGYKVLLIDLDPQKANASFFLFGDQEFPKSSGDLFNSKVKWKDLLVEKDGLKVIPANDDLTGIEPELNKLGGHFVLKKALKDLAGFDYVFIDCPPHLGMITYNALIFADEVFVPVKADVTSLKALEELVETVEAAREYNPDLKISGIVLTFYSERKRICQAVEEEIKKAFPKELFKTPIRQNVSLEEMPAQQADIFTYAPSSNGADDYIKLCKEITKRK